jgi:hypothetical protein
MFLTRIHLECFGPGIIPMITTPAPKEIIYPKMPNKGLRKMQAKPLLNITKQFKTKIMSTISNFVNTVIAIIKGDDAEVIGLKIQKRAVAVFKNAKVCRTLSLEGIEDLAEDNLNKARNNGTLIVNDDQYIQKLLDAKFKFDQG